jgi:hypothetical protein
MSKCRHPVVEDDYIGAWCASPKFKCLSCGVQLKTGDTMYKGTVLNPKGDRAVLKRTGKLGQLKDSDLQYGKPSTTSTQKT